MKALFFLMAIFIMSCGQPFEVCNQQDAQRCYGGSVMYCSGGYWYPQVDCEEINMSCTEEGGVRCQPR